MQLLVLEHIPLLQLAQMACLGKEMRAAYLARLALREAIISSLPRVSDGAPGSRPVTLGDLLDAQPQLSTALPRDLVGVPEVCLSLSPDSTVCSHGPKPPLPLFTVPCTCLYTRLFPLDETSPHVPNLPLT
jgi:hypothetical protein